MPESDDNSNTPTSLRALRRQGQRLTEEEKEIAQEKFLRSFSMTANLRAACMSAGIDRSTAYYWQEVDEEFSIKFQIAEAEANDIIRAELFRRAIQGVERPVVSVGKLVYHEGKPLTVREYSDALLSLLAKSRMPEFHEKRNVDLNATVSGRIETEHTLVIDVRALSPEKLAALKTFALGMKIEEEVEGGSTS